MRSNFKKRFRPDRIDPFGSYGVERLSASHVRGSCSNLTRSCSVRLNALYGTVIVLVVRNVFSRCHIETRPRVIAFRVNAKLFELHSATVSRATVRLRDVTSLKVVHRRTRYDCNYTYCLVPFVVAFRASLEFRSFAWLTFQRRLENRF